MDGPVLLCGLGQLGWRVLEFLRSTGAKITVLDNHVRGDDPRLEGIPVICGDFRNAAVLEAAGVRQARGVLIITSDDLVNVSTALTVRRLNPDCRIVVRMFNQNLLASLGTAIRNTTALSVSALTAPLLALSAVTGESLGAFKLEHEAQQIAEILLESGSPLLGMRLNQIATQHELLIFAYQSAQGMPRFLHDLPGDIRLTVNDRLVVCGSPVQLERLHALSRGERLPGVRWAGRLHRFARTLRRTIAEIDLPVKVGGSLLVLTLLLSTLVLHYGLGLSWVDGLYETVTIITTDTELHGENQPAWAKLFLSVMKLAGVALFAGFTAIFTNYLIRARLRGALEAGQIPDGGHLVVCGLGNVGYRCVEELVRMGRPLVAVEKVNDNPFAATVRRMGVPVIIGDATIPEVLRQARVDTARAVVAAVESELANLEIALLVRSLNPQQRVVARFDDSDFALAVREAAGIKLAISTAALAAPAFAAALYGDRVHTLVAIFGRTFAIVEFQVQAGDRCFHEQSLMATIVDYQLLPLALAGQEPFPRQGIPGHYRLKANDRLTVIIGIPDLERLLRREPPQRAWEVFVDSHLAISAAALLPILRTARGCSQDDAERLLAQPQFTLASQLSRGEAEELLARIQRERVRACIRPCPDLGRKNLAESADHQS